MKGIVLAGGTGSRLWPVTRGVSKQLIPVYDKPMIYYPLSTLMLAGIRDVLVITTPFERPQFERLLGDGSRFGIRIEYAEQHSPDGLAQAFLIGAEFIGDDTVALVLGDNLFHGPGFDESLRQHASVDGGLIFAYEVAEPSRYGVVDFDPDGRARSIEEKPDSPRSRYAVPGLYFYSSDVVGVAASCRPSARGELEISAVNQQFLNEGRLAVRRLDRGTAWLDSGTVDSLMQASEYVKVVEQRQGIKIGCLEEIAFRAGWIDAGELAGSGEQQRASGYGEYLLGLLDS